MVKIHESSQPKVSVLIPVHRNDINFEKALESVNFSCYANFDILVLDNTDIGINIDFLKQFDRVKYFRLQPHHPQGLVTLRRRPHSAVCDRSDSGARH